MLPILRIINDVWSKSLHALKVSVVNTSAVSVSVASLPLPAGAAAEAGGNLDAQTFLAQQRNMQLKQQIDLQKILAAGSNGFVPTETLEFR
jgi:hypothetical protein